MGFLAPLFLAGVAAVALPVWLHRLQTQSSDKQRFASAMLLEATEERVHVRRKLKYLLLLGSRIALLTLLAVAFSKPFWTQPPAALQAQTSAYHVIVVDTSASMTRRGVFSAALETAERILDEIGAADRVQLVAADKTLHVLTPMTSDRTQIVAALAGLRPTAQRLDYGALMSTIGSVLDPLDGRSRLHLVSDLQASAAPALFADMVPSVPTRLLLHPVGTEPAPNASIEYARRVDDAIVAGLRVFDSAERTLDVELTVNGELSQHATATVTRQSELRFESPALASGANRVELRLETADELALDNRYFLVVDNAPPQPVPVLTANGGGLPLTYLAAAFAAAGDKFEVVPLVLGRFDHRVLSRYRWLIIDDIGALDEDLAKVLGEFLRDGGSVLAFAADVASRAGALPLSGHRPGPARLGEGDTRRVGRIDRTHPALATTEGWHNVRVLGHLAVAPREGERTLITLDNGDPLLIEQSFDAGRLLLALIGVDRRWSDFPVRPVFVNFLVEIAHYLGGTDRLAHNYTVGAALPLSVIGGTSGQVIDPNGRSLFSLEGTRQAQVIGLDQTGFYEVYTSQEQSLIAVNPDARESDPLPMDRELLRRWQDTVNTGADADGRVAAAGEPAGTPTLALWPWMLLLLGVVAVVESILGNAHLTVAARGR